MFSFKFIEFLKDYYFELFVRKIEDLHFFGVSYEALLLSFSGHICLILHDLCSLALMSVHLNEQTSSSLYRLLLEGKTFL